MNINKIPGSYYLSPYLPIGEPHVPMRMPDMPIFYMKWERPAMTLEEKRRIIKFTFEELVRKHNLFPHPKFKGRYIIPKRDGSVTKYGLDFFLQENIIETLKFQFDNADSLISTLETLIMVYLHEDDLDDDGNVKNIPESERIIFAPYTEITKITKEFSKEWLKNAKTI
jgi:hypothetical protein